MKKIAYALCSGLAVLFLANCNSGNAELEKEKLAIEKAKLELESKKLTQGTEGNQSPSQAEGDNSPSKSSGEPKEAKGENDEAARRKIAEKATQANRFQNYTDAVVVAKKTFFYNMPDESTRRSAYLIQGDRIMVEKSQRNYVYVTFTNETTGRTTAGWLKSDDLEPIDSPEFYD
ncbi:MAG: hypothetical protein ACK454_07485 [Flavobacteriales bacterium]|jgi:hypothetical protein